MIRKATPNGALLFPVIRGIVDRSRRLASPFGGPALLRKYYKRVQLASPVWIVARIHPEAPQFGGWSAIFSKPVDLAVSASYNPLHLPLRPGSIHLRAEALAASAEDARNIADNFQHFVDTFHSAESSLDRHQQGSDPDVNALFDSLQARQEGDAAVLVATMPPGFLKKMLSDPPLDLPSVVAPAPSVPVPPAKQR